MKRGSLISLNKTYVFIEGSVSVKQTKCLTASFVFLLLPQRCRAWWRRCRTNVFVCSRSARRDFRIASTCGATLPRYMNHNSFTLSVETLWTLWKHSWRWCDREETHWALHTTEPTQPLTSTCRRVLQVTSWGGRTCFLKMLLNYNKHHWTVNNWFIHVFFKTIYSQWVRVVSMSSNNDKTLTSKSVFFSFLLKKSFHRFYLLIKNLFLKSSLNLFYF